MSQVAFFCEAKNSINERLNKQKRRASSRVFSALDDPSGSVFCEQSIQLFCLLFLSKFDVRPGNQVLLFKKSQNSTARFRQRQLYRAQPIHLFSQTPRGGDKSRRRTYPERDTALKVFTYLDDGCEETQTKIYSITLLP